MISLHKHMKTICPSMTEKKSVDTANTQLHAHELS
jgi:hypothetical protein